MGIYLCLFYPQNDLQRYITLIWFVLDVFILMQFLRYAPNEYRKMLSKKLLYFSFLITLIFSMLIILGIVYEFQDFEGKYVAFFQNLMMSGLFIALLLQENLAGQSMGIAVCKMVGTLFRGGWLLSILPHTFNYHYFCSNALL